MEQPPLMVQQKQTFFKQLLCGRPPPPRPLCLGGQPRKIRSIDWAEGAAAVAGWIWKVIGFEAML